MRLHSARLPRGAKVLAVGHHRRRDGAWRWRLDVLVDNLAIDAFAVTLAVADVDVVVLVYVVGCLIDGVGVVAGDVAVDRLIDSAVANVGVKIAIGRVGCVDVRILIDVCHRARIDVVIRVHRGAGANIDVVVGVGVCRCAGRCVGVVIGVGAGGRIVVVRCAGRGRGIDVFRWRSGCGLCQHHRR